LSLPSFCLDETMALNGVQQYKTCQHI
jgi:hypothetical protein